MNCSGCGHDNRANASFCEGCGARLERRCGGCGEPLRDTAWLCDHCGHKVTDTASAREVRAYTQKHLAEQVDAETWHAILDRLFSILTEGVHRFEGTVNQYTGDGIMALFGAPLALNDHTQRTCYAALHLRVHRARYAPCVRLVVASEFGG